MILVCTLNFILNENSRVKNNCVFIVITIHKPRESLKTQSTRDCINTEYKEKEWLRELSNSNKTVLKIRIKSLTFRSIIIFIKRNVHFIRIKFPSPSKKNKRTGKEASGKEEMVSHCFAGRTFCHLRTKMQFIARKNRQREITHPHNDSFLLYKRQSTQAYLMQLQHLQ